MIIVLLLKKSKITKDEIMKVIRDTREKQGWDFIFYDNIDIVDQKLDCGDYTTENLKDIIVIERKATAAEIANNLGKLTARARFYREFERMESLQKAYIVCEFSESDVYEYPKNSGISEAKLKKVRMNGKRLRRLMSNIESDCENIEVVFCGNRDAAEKFTYDTLSFWEKNSGAKS